MRKRRPEPATSPERTGSFHLGRMRSGQSNLSRIIYGHKEWILGAPVKKGKLRQGLVGPIYLTYYVLIASEKFSLLSSCGHDAFGKHFLVWLH